MILKVDGILEVITKFLTVFQFTKEIKQELFRRELILLHIVASFRRISKPSVCAKIFSKETTSFIAYTHNLLYGIFSIDSFQF